MSGLQDLQNRFRRSSTPATIVILAILIAGMVVSLFAPTSFFLNTMLTSTFQPPWGILTYSFVGLGVGAGIIFTLLLLWWFYWIGTSLERDIGSTKLVAFFMGAAILGGLSLVVGGGVSNRTVIELGAGLVVAALTVGWATRNPSSTIMLYGVIPLSGQVLLYLTLALTFFGYSSKYSSPLMGVFSCIPLGAAVLFGKNLIPGFTYSGSRSTRSSGKASASSRVLKATEKKGDSYYDDVRRREQERAERERLRKLFEKSVNEDGKDKER